MKPKKYKSVTGYLRGQSRNSDENAERRIINHLLPQLGITATIADDEPPYDGIKRLQQSTADAAQLKALKDCLKWLCRPRFVSAGVTVIPQVKTAEGLVSYHVNGFRRGDTKSRVSMIVDTEQYAGGAHEMAEKIAGPEYCFHACTNINHLVPDSAKNRLFMSDEELYAADPQLRPRYLRRAAS